MIIFEYRSAGMPWHSCTTIVDHQRTESSRRRKPRQKARQTR